MDVKKLKFNPLSTPLLILSDNPTYPTGLARSARDIATLACTLPQFRVGFLGRGIGQNRKLPFILYDYPEVGQWGEGYIVRVWEDFSDGQPGIVLSTDDLSRRHWLVNTVGLPTDLAEFVHPATRNHYTWAYVPVDSTGPNGQTLPFAQRDCASRYDRVLAASEWGRNTLVAGGRTDADWLPHGIWTDKFHPVADAKKLLDWEGKIVVATVMANQSRKDYPAAFEAFAALRQHYGSKFRAWVHTDALIHYWSLPALAADYGLDNCLEVTDNCNDEQLALRYSGCDCTILPSAGEGFGFPIAESLACGTACIVTNYAAGPELVEPDCQVLPVAYRVDTMHNVLRAVLSGYAFAEAAKVQIEKKIVDREYESERLASTVAHLDWNRLKVLWSRWLLAGLK